MTKPTTPQNRLAAALRDDHQLVCMRDHDHQTDWLADAILAIEAEAVQGMVSTQALMAAIEHERAEAVKPWREALLDAYTLLPPDRIDLLRRSTHDRIATFGRRPTRKRLPPESAQKGNSIVRTSSSYTPPESGE